MAKEEQTISSPSSSKEELPVILEGMRSGKTDGIKELQELLSRHPDCVEVMGHLAWALAHKGGYESAIRIYRKYLEIQPENFEVRWMMGDRLVNLGRLDEAFQVYKGVLNDHPDCMDARTGVRYVEYLRSTKTKGEKPYSYPQKSLTQLQEENLNLNRREFKQNQMRLKSLPSQLYLESTTKCNFYCRTCNKGYGAYYAEDLQRDILDKVKSEIMPRVCRISITGFGEPTMSAHFDEILNMAIQNGSHVHFVTNSSLLNFRRLEQLTRSHVEIQISLDGATRETVEDIRTGSHFDQICERLAMIKKLRDINLSEFYTIFSLLFVALKKNIHELPDVVRLAHRYRINGVGVMDYAYIFRAFDEQALRFDPERANHYMQEARKVAEELGVDLDLPPTYSIEALPLPSASLWNKIKAAKHLFPFPNRIPQLCYSPWMEPYIHTDGLVHPCCTSREYMGNLKEKPFRDIWNGWRYRLLRYRIHSILPSPWCRGCHVSWGINGGNPGNIMAQEGLLVKIFYFCENRFRRLLDIISTLPAKMGFNKKKCVAMSPNFFQGRPLVETENKSEESKGGAL